VIEGTCFQQGSNWNNSSNAGPFYWNLNNSFANRNQNIGARTSFVRKLGAFIQSQTVPLGKTGIRQARTGRYAERSGTAQSRRKDETVWQSLSFDL
jgi:hypothetical protein